MPIQPKPFTLKCPKCGWKKRIQPRSDLFDESWGISSLQCPKCGTHTERTTEESLLDEAIDTLKNIFDLKK